MDLPNSEHFNIKDCVIGGDDCVFITAKDITCKWTEDNLHFRSIILRKSDHKVINSSWKKFHNLSEQPDLAPFPDESFTAINKMDGSTLIFGIHNNEIIHRTRGTLNCLRLDNGHEIYFLKEKYPKLWTAIYLNPNYSIITEWETPNNYIVLRRVTEPTLTLTGVIDNITLKYLSQVELDELAMAWGLDRPKTYSFESIKECVESVTTWKNLEGVVIYSACGQFFRKIKADEYLSLHKTLFGLKSINNVIDLFLTTEKFTKYEDFYQFVLKSLDFEVAERIKVDMLKIVNAYNKTLEQLDKVRLVVHNVRGDSFTRKDQAIEIVQHFPDWRRSAAFMILDDKQIETKLIKTAIEINLLNTSV